MNESISYSTEKDQILKFLVDYVGAPTITDISEILNLDHHLCFTLTEEFEERGFVKSIEVNTRVANKPDKLIELLPKGRVFINEGGYSSETEREIKNANKKSGLQYVDLFHKIVTALAALGMLWLGFYSVNLQNKIDELEMKIQSIELQSVNNSEAQVDTSLTNTEVDSFINEPTE